MGGSALHENAISVSLSTTRRPTQKDPAPDRSGVVVRLELPDGQNRRAGSVPDDGRASILDVGQGSVADAGRGAIADGAGSSLDAGRLARAVEDLIRAIDPSLTGTRVEVQVTHGRATPSVPTSDRAANPGTGWGPRPAPHPTPHPPPGWGPRPTPFC